MAAKQKILMINSIFWISFPVNRLSKRLNRMQFSENQSMNHNDQELNRNWTINAIIIFKHEHISQKVY